MAVRNSSPAYFGNPSECELSFVFISVAVIFDPGNSARKGWARTDMQFPIEIGSNQGLINMICTHDNDLHNFVSDWQANIMSRFVPHIVVGKYSVPWDEVNQTP